MPKPVKSSHAYVPGLDGLRTLAVALVILYHLQVPFIPGGLLGVGVFFTLSGYLITANLMRAWDADMTLGLKTFWFRRFRRLMPAATVTLAVVLLLSAPFRPSQWFSDATSALSAFFYVNNWYTIVQEKSYFDNFSGLAPLDHMWSLSVEEQFYVVWPLLLFALLVMFRSRIGVWLGAILLAGASFAVMFAVADVGIDNTRAYEGTDTRAGGLLLGAALAIWLSYKRHKRGARGKTFLIPLWLSNCAGFVGITGIIALALLVQKDSFFLYQGGFIVLSCASVLAIIAVLHEQSLWSAVLGWEPMRWLGERSYGIYLWHMPVIAFMPQQWLEEHRLAASMYAIMASIVIAAVSWKYIEDPIRQHGIVEPYRQWKIKNRERFASYGTGTIAVILVALLSVGLPPGINGVATATKATSQTQKMELEPRNELHSESSSEPSSTSRGHVETSTNAAAGILAKNNPEGVKDEQLTQCTTLIHIGDSTSIGMFSSDMVREQNFTAREAYAQVGVTNLVESVFGARSTIEGWTTAAGEKYPSAQESVQELLDEGVAKDSCWFIAVGVNDAANQPAGSPITSTERIEAIMALLKDYDVIWSTATTNTTNGYYAKKHMESFNAALLDATKKYPRLRLYDWAVEAQSEWFATGDYAHYGATGNTERAQRFAAVLVKAFPKGKKPSTERVLRSGK